MSYLFTSESVSEGHPDKLCDQISDALLDAFLAKDPESKVACETLVTTGLVVCSGEVNTSAYVDVDTIVRGVIEKVGYTKSEYQFDSKSCGIMSTIHGQSGDINQGVVRKEQKDQGAGDQGMMFGYACDEMDNYMPLTVELAHRLVQELAAIRKEGKKMKYLRPDSKSQVTVQYSDDNIPEKIDTIVVSTQHDEFDKEKKMQAVIKKDVQEILIPRVIRSCPKNIQKLFKDFDYDNKLYVNPTGKFV
ncbi:MAG: methionine adenosyltransferase, partial [Bacteroidales bacterium]|nr:methionine adenosyltransferase [Bacteroidales bacterium]